MLRLLLCLLFVVLGCGPAERERGRGATTKPGGEGCEPRTCELVELECGELSDGCGGVISCGCEAPLVCDAETRRCTEPSGGCTPRTCAEAGKNCGSISDGCGGVISCGVCPQGQNCGGGGANVCGSDTCSPESDREFCTRLGKDCGALVEFDNCDDSRSVASCGSCASGKVCGATSPNLCGCAPLDAATECAARGAECGSITVSTPCGQKTIQCGGCAGGVSCSANLCDDDRGLPGAACSLDSQCRGLRGESGRCLQLQGGYCVAPGCTLSGSDCPAGSMCVQFSGGFNACVEGPCARNSDCARSSSGYICDVDSSCWIYEWQKAPIGAACGDDSECASGSCLSQLHSPEWLGGYCSKLCTSDSECPDDSFCSRTDTDDHRICVDRCSRNSDCRESEGYVCNGGKCMMRSGNESSVRVGAACGTDTDCDIVAGAGGICIASMVADGMEIFRNGYCVAPGCTPRTNFSLDSCPGGSACFSFGTSLQPFCLKTCTTNDACRASEGYSCVEDIVCWP